MSRAAAFRILCGSLTLVLGLVSVMSGLSYVGGLSGRDVFTILGMSAWGLGLACAGVWLIRGRSKGKAVVFARDRRRLIIVGVLFVLVVGLLAYLMVSVDDGGPVTGQMMLQTMFANLFASIPFLLFDREDYKERDTPVPLRPAQRKRARSRMMLIAGVGALFVAGRIFFDQQLDRWWEGFLTNAGMACIGAAAALGYRLRKAPRLEPDAETH